MVSTGRVSKKGEVAHELDLRPCNGPIVRFFIECRLD
jgi:hypothetical protein